MGSIFKVGNQWVIEHAGKQERIGMKFAKAIVRIREAGVTLTPEEIADTIIENVNASHCGTTPASPTVRECVEKHVEFLTHNKQNRTGPRSASYFKHFVALYGDKPISEISRRDLEEYETIRLRSVLRNTVTCPPIIGP